ncbi:hypothetical protein M3182_16090 [Mesobacillus maritimus]|uniref:hypothetical protein n=1 Tax=Mesobacillus maritimus TaxID=1643336 RepID=UPI00204133F2|nr:hypothetical protein [Mesobacillus maritimus]MCM3667825.1 hypothetical protein [Mesobacillus maritimus]
MKKKYMIIILILLIGIGSVVGYINYKQYSVKKAVEDYLLNEQNIDKEDIEELDPFIANLKGDKNWLVYVKIKEDDKKYYYYRDSKTDKVLLESYILNGKEYTE